MDPQATIENLVRQFADQTVVDGVPSYSTGGLSALENAFAVLGWDDPHPAPDPTERDAGGMTRVGARGVSNGRRRAADKTD
jgi:hypothetical protein